MPTLDASWSGRIRRIGDLERPDHCYLTVDDRCAFFGEYTARAGYGHSATNQLIHNLKKRPETRGTAQWRYKGEAIREVGRAIAKTLNPSRSGRTVFVPIPPSKPVDHPEYDDRMVQVARAIGAQVDVREALYTLTERDPAHANASLRDPEALRATLALRRDLASPAPEHVVLLDDVLTTGCSFRVCKALLSEMWPHAEVVGLFVARRIIGRPDPTAAFGDVDPATWPGSS